VADQTASDRPDPINGSIEKKQDSVAPVSPSEDDQALVNSDQTGSNLTRLDLTATEHSWMGRAS
jgi:hypothetical protein